MKKSWLLIGAALLAGGYWYYKHKTCSPCQQKWNELRKKYFGDGKAA